MTRVSVAYGAVLLAVVTSGCALIDLDQLVPTTAVDWTAPTEQLLVVNKCSVSAKATIASGPLSYASVSQTTATLSSVLPDQIKNDPLVQAVTLHAKYISAKSTNVAAFTAQAGGASDSAPNLASPKLNLGPQQFGAFARMVSENVLRHTPSTSGAGNTAPSNEFWTVVKAYYKAYFDGKFTNYFGTTFSQPAVSNTVSDTEITEATSVFLELIMDAIFQSPVWLGSDGNYYPGGNKNVPTFLSVTGQKPSTIQNTLYGCGMNIPKANTVRYLAQAFTKAAAAESSLTIKSVGGIEIGFGLLGKVSIGDNSTLSALAQALVSEIVGRFTVALAVPVLTAIDIEQQPTLKAAHSSGRPGANTIRVLSTPFVSSNAAH